MSNNTMIQSLGSDWRWYRFGLALWVFLAACASPQTETARTELEEPVQTSRKNEPPQVANADLTAGSERVAGAKELLPVPDRPSQNSSGQAVEKPGRQPSADSGPVAVAAKAAPKRRSEPIAKATAPRPRVQSQDSGRPVKEESFEAAKAETVAAPAPPKRAAGRAASLPDREPENLFDAATAGGPPASVVVAPSPPRRPNHPDTGRIRGVPNPDMPGRVAAETSPPVLPEGTVIEIRLAEEIGTERNEIGDSFTAVLEKDLKADDSVVVKKGTTLYGRIVDVLEPGKVKGRASLTFTLEEIALPEVKYRIRTSEITMEAESSKGKDAKKVGVATAVGTALGAIFGGKKGAAIGGATGAGAGTAGVLLTKGDDVRLEKERFFSFRLEEDLPMKSP